MGRTGCVGDAALIAEDHRCGADPIFSKILLRNVALTSNGLDCLAPKY